MSSLWRQELDGICVLTSEQIARAWLDKNMRGLHHKKNGNKCDCCLYHKYRRDEADRAKGEAGFNSP